MNPKRGLVHLGLLKRPPPPPAPFHGTVILKIQKSYKISIIKLLVTYSWFFRPLYRILGVYHELRIVRELFIHDLTN